MALNHSIGHTVLGYSVWAVSSEGAVWRIDTSDQQQNDVDTDAKFGEVGAVPPPPKLAIKV